jgi:cyclophilin family peptidyl-prolyl cis-trans isomerase
MKICNLLRRRPQQTIRRQPSARSRWLPYLEVLEDRVTPAIAGFGNTAPTIAPAVVTGVVFADLHNNNVQDAGDPSIPGVRVTLAGNTNDGAAVNVSTTTDANGQFIFFQVLPGTYSLSRDAISSFIDGQSKYGNLGGTPGNNAISTISVAEGQTAVDYTFAVRGLAPSAISLRDFLNTSTPAQQAAQVLPSAGPGFTAADGSVQPSTAAIAGSASLAGSVLDSSNNGVQGVEIALTGIDSTGRAIFQTTTTDANGAYQFSGLQGGTFMLNVVEQPAGFVSGEPTVGSVGGQILRNGQIGAIQLTAGAVGNQYNFSEMPMTVLGANAGLAISAALADDTAGPGGTNTDGITSDPSIQGSVASSSPVVSFQAGFDATPAANFADILSSLSNDGLFFLNPALLALVAGGTLTNGVAHTVHLHATNAQGQASNQDVNFTLQNAAPTVPTLHLDTVSDPNGTGITNSSNVTLMGQSSPGVQVALIRGGTTLTTTTASGSGAYSFGNITLQSGANDFTVQATDNAGNTSQLQTFFVRESAPVAVPTASVSESATPGGSDKIVDLSSPTLFTSGNFSPTLIRFNTSAGPIHVQLLDTQAPQTVANFLDYITAGTYNDSIFNRLATNFVLQGGGITLDPVAQTLTQITTGPAVPNEFDNTNRPNVVGTIAMAKSPSNPDSATSQFFFNLVDNTKTLDSSNNSGFTVFGRVVSGADQRVINTLTAATVTDESRFMPSVFGSGSNSALATLPLNNYHGTNFPIDTTAANFDLINSISVLRQSEQLTFSIVSNSDTAGTIETASIKQGQLEIHPLAAGAASITVMATDKAGNTATVTFTVTVA